MLQSLKIGQSDATDVFIIYLSTISCIICVIKLTFSGRNLEIKICLQVLAPKINAKEKSEGGKTENAVNFLQFRSNWHQMKAKYLRNTVLQVLKQEKAIFSMKR